MELLVGALQVAARRQQIPFGLRHEGDVHGGGTVGLADLHQALRKRGSQLVLSGPGRYQQARASGRGERHRHLELGIVAAAGTLIGIGPPAIENVFAARMRFEIAGDDPDDLAIALGHEMLRHPPGFGRRRTRRFQCRQKSVRNEWIISGA
jgi:hypothetical protein